MINRPHRSLVQPRVTISTMIFKRYWPARAGTALALVRAYDQALTEVAG